MSNHTLINYLGYQAVAISGFFTAFFSFINPLLQCILLCISIWAAIKALKNADKFKHKNNGTN